MHRRTFLTVVTGTVTGLAGCTSSDIDVDLAPTDTETPTTGSTPTITAEPGLESPTGTPTATFTSTPPDTPPNLVRPWQSLPVVVTATGQTDAVPEYRQAIGTALDYWETHDEPYLGYTLRFDFQSEPADPDIRLQFVTDITECDKPDHGRVMGCAPILTGTVESAVDVQIKTGLEFEETVLAVKHELGHTFGLTHDDAPQHIMSNDPADRTKNYEAKQAIINAYNTGINTYNNGIDLKSEAGQEWDARNYSRAATQFQEAAPHFDDAATSFGTAHDRAVSIDRSRVAEACIDAKQRAYYMAEAMRHIAEAADAYAINNNEYGDSAYAKYDEAYSKAQQYKITHSKRIIDALGLD